MGSCKQAGNDAETGPPDYRDFLLMGRKIESLLAVDCKQRAANAASTVKIYLSNGAVKEAWRALKGWYRSAEI